MADDIAPPPEIALNLAFAVIESSNTPLLLLDGDLIVIAASASFCHAFRIDLAASVGQGIFALGSGESGTSPNSACCRPLRFRATQRSTPMRWT